MPGIQAFDSLSKAIYGSSAISLHGFDCYAGDSYGSAGLSQATSFLSSDVQTANEAARFDTRLISSRPGWDGERPNFVLLVGSTPTGHSASAETRTQLRLVLHAGK